MAIRYAGVQLRRIEMKLAVFLAAIAVVPASAQIGAP